jgi:hypothetical protein
VEVAADFCKVIPARVEIQDLLAVKRQEAFLWWIFLEQWEK